MPPQFQSMPEHKKFNQNSTMTMDQGAPYSINMNVFLPDVPYLRTGLCRPTRPTLAPQMKPEPMHTLSYPSCHSTIPTAHPPTEYTHHFSPASGTCSSAFIKQETPELDYQDVPLFQLLNSDLDPVVPGPHSSMSSYNSMNSSITPIARMCDMGSCGSSTARHFGRHHQQLNVPYLPPSPPNSEPSSPDRRKELLHKLSPPPSYAASIASKLAGPALGPQAAVPVQTQAVAARQNRRNNPDLDKRRIHHCSVPGEMLESTLLSGTIILEHQNQLCHVDLQIVVSQNLMILVRNQNASLRFFFTSHRCIAETICKLSYAPVSLLHLSE